MKDKKVIVSSQHRFMNGKSHLTEPIVFSNKVTSLVGKLEKGTFEKIKLSFSKLHIH